MPWHWAATHNCEVREWHPPQGAIWIHLAQITKWTTCTTVQDASARKSTKATGRWGQKRLLTSRESRKLAWTMCQLNWTFEWGKMEDGEGHSARYKRIWKGTEHVCERTIILFRWLIRWHSDGCLPHARNREGKKGKREAVSMAGVGQSMCHLLPKNCEFHSLRERARQGLGDLAISTSKV